MLQLMLDAAGKKLEKDDISPQCLLFLLAGYDTSSAVLGFACHSLALNPDVQEKLKEEIDHLWPEEEVLLTAMTTAQIHNTWMASR